MPFPEPPRMPAGQPDLFALAPALPPGFRHWDEAIPPEEERALLGAFAALDFVAFAFHGTVLHGAAVRAH